MRYSSARDSSALIGELHRGTARPEWESESHRGLHPDDASTGERQSAPVPKSRTTARHLRFEEVCEPVERLRAEGRWEDLVARYAALAERADDPAARAAHLGALASVLRDDLDDAPRAFEALLETVRLDPSDDASLDALEDLAARLQRTSEFLDVIEVGVRKRRGARDQALRLLERAVHAVQGVPGAERQLDRLVAGIRAIAPEHPAVARRDADLFGAEPDVDACHEALERARLRGAGNEERDAHVALGRLYETMPGKLDAARGHFVRAYELDRGALPALEGLERVLSAMDKPRDVAAVLERQANAATDKRTREGALLRASLLHEFELGELDVAIGKYQRVLRVTPESREARAGIDRCLEKKSAWDERAVDLLGRAERADAVTEKVKLFVTLARVQETRLLDGDGATHTLLKAHALDDQDRGVLFDLARLGEKNHDYPAAAAYRARLASLIGDPETRARLYVRIGQMLAEGGRDRTAARLHFERAVAIDGAHLEAWEGLQALAESTGDDARLAAALTMHAELAPDPGERVELYLELAGLLTSQGDARGATAAWETALTLAPDNEEAARALLGAYVRGERWRDALPLCELLLRTTPATDELLLHQLHDRCAHLALACDDPARALTAALAAFELRPDEAREKERVVDLAFRLRADGEATERARRALDAIAAAEDAPSPDALFKLGAMALLRQDTDAAIDLFERVLAITPHHRPSLTRLGELHGARGDWQRAAACKRLQAEGAEGADEAFRLLVEAGELLAHRALDLEGAADDFASARALRPDDRMLLHTQLSIYKQLERWSDVAATLRDIADCEPDPRHKAKGLFAMAQVVEAKVGDPKRAAELFDEVVALDPTRLDAFEHIARIHTELRDWSALTAAHHALLNRLPEGEADLRQALHKRLGLVYRDRLVDAERSIQAFREALELCPDDDECRRHLADLLVVTGDLDGALEVTLRAVRRDPMAIEPMRELYTLFLRKHAFDRAWCAVDVLSDTLLAKLNDEQERFCVSYPPTSLDLIPGTLVASAWDSHILHPDLDPTLTTLFRLAMPAVVRATVADVPRAEREAWLGTPLSSDGSGRAYPIIRAFLDAAEVLGVSAPDLRLDPSLRSPFAVALAERPTLRVSMELASELSPGSLAYLAGKYIALLQPELFAHAALGSVDALRRLLRAAARVATSEAPPSPDADAFELMLRAELSPDEMVALRGAALTVVDAAPVEPAPDSEDDGALPPSLDVMAWIDLVELSAARAALLLAGSVDSARRASVHEPRPREAWSTKEWLGQLVLFAVGVTYAELRAAIGVGVRTDEERAAFARPTLLETLEE